MDSQRSPATELEILPIYLVSLWEKFKINCQYCYINWALLDLGRGKV